jgi:hypothetical protein
MGESHSINPVKLGGDGIAEFMIPTERDTRAGRGYQGDRIWINGVW